MDWNFAYDVLRRISFEPTYKGLKCSLNFTNRWRPFPCFEPTYKGLKFTVYYASDDNWAGFEPTYKGLKYLKKQIIKAGGFVSSLPIRD